MASTARRRVLVVDDDATIASTFHVILASEGYDVATASEGGEAIALACREPFDVILLDLVMPGMDGLAALRELRQLRPRPAVVILAADVEPETEMEAFGLGAAAIMLKPPDVHKLLRIVDELTSREPA